MTPRKLRTGWRRLHGMKGEIWLTVRIVYGDGKPYIIHAATSEYGSQSWQAELPANQHLGPSV